MTLVCYIEGELYDSGTTALAIEMLLLSNTQQEACGIDSSPLLPPFWKCLFVQSFIKHLKQLAIQNGTLRVLVLSQSPNTLQCHSEAP